MSRVLYETVIVLVMVAVLVLGLLQWVMDTLTSGDTTTTSHIVVSDHLLSTVYMGRAYTKMMHIKLYSVS